MRNRFWFEWRFRDGDRIRVYAHFGWTIVVLVLLHVPAVRRLLDLVFWKLTFYIKVF